MMSDELRLEWIPLSKLNEWDRNPKSHSISDMCESFKRHGFRDAVILDPVLGENVVIAGNGRIETLKQMKAQGQPAPRGIRVDGDEWLVPVQTGIASKSEKDAYAFGLDHNNLTILGGDGFNAFDIARLYDEDSYTAMLKELAEQAALPISVSGDDLDSLINPPQSEPSAGLSMADGLQYRVIVDCASELHQKELLERFEIEGLTCRALIS